MRQKHLLTALAIFAVAGAVNYSQNLAEAWQGNIIKNLNEMMTKAANVNDYPQQKSWKSSAQLDRSLSFPNLLIARDSVDRGRSKQELIHKVGADAYSGMSGNDMRSDAARSQQGPISTPGDYSRNTGEYKSGSSSNESRYGPNPSDNYFRKESPGTQTPTAPYSETIYGGVPTTPSADPMIKELSR